MREQLNRATASMRPVRLWAAGFLPASLLWLCLPLAAHADCAPPSDVTCDSTFFVCQTGGPCAYSVIQTAVNDAEALGSGNTCVIICDGQTYTDGSVSIPGGSPSQLIIAGSPDAPNQPTIAPADTADAVITVTAISTITVIATTAITPTTTTATAIAPITASNCAAVSKGCNCSAVMNTSTTFAADTAVRGDESLLRFR